MSAADAANQAYAQCLFAVSRQASDAKMSPLEFEQKLKGACTAEQRTLEDAAGKVLTLRGDQDGAARAHDLAAQARQQVIDSYRKAQELQPLLKTITAACRAHPEQCKQ